MILFNIEKALEVKIKEEIRKKHKKKFNAIQEQQKRELNIKHDEGWLVNKTNIDIPENVKWILSHGKKFALPHTREDFPLLKYLADGEECIKTSNDRETQEIAKSKFTTMIENHMNKHRLTNRDKFIV